MKAQHLPLRRSADGTSRTFIAVFFLFLFSFCSFFLSSVGKEREQTDILSEISKQRAKQGAGTNRYPVETCFGAVSTFCDDRWQGDGDGSACIELGDCSLGTQRSRHSEADTRSLSAALP